MNSLFVRQTAVLVILILFQFIACRPEKTVEAPISNSPFLNHHSLTVDSLLSTFTLKEKTAQLIAWEIVDTTITNIRSASKLMTLGCYLWKGNDLRRFIDTIGKEDLNPQFPVLLGTLKRLYLQEDYDFPGDQALAAVAEDSLVELYHRLFLHRLKQAGFHLNFDLTLPAPTFQPLNPNHTAQQLNVILPGRLKVMSEQHILSAAKIDYLYEDPCVDLQNGIWENDFIQKSVLQGLSAIRIEEGMQKVFQTIPADSVPDLLLRHLGFNGLIFDSFSPDETALEWQLRAGIDFFIVSGDPQTAHAALTSIFRKKKLPVSLLDQKVRRILLSKSWAGLLDTNEPDKISQKQVLAFNSKQDVLLAKKLKQASIPLMSNQDKAIPVHNSKLNSIFVYSVGEERPNEFINEIRNYCSPGTQHIRITDPQSILSLNVNRLKRFDPVVIVLNDIQLDTVLNKGFVEAFLELESKTNVICVNAGNPENLGLLNQPEHCLQLFEKDPESDRFAAQIIMGGLQPKGRFPYNGISGYAAGHFVEGRQRTRFRYVIPEEAGIASEALRKIDSIAWEAISGAAPGCQVLIAKSGQIFYHKSFGHHTYDRIQRVNKTDLYDLASISKVAGTTVAAMHLYDQGRFKMQDSLYQFLSDQTYSNEIGNLSMGSLFSHQSGLQANMPVIQFINYRDSLIGKYDRFFCWDDRQHFSVKVAENYYLGAEYPDSILANMLLLEVDTAQNYRYSDANFNMIQYVMETISEQPLNEYLNTHVYGPLQLDRLTYLPTESYELDQIVPTEYDRYWRNQLVHGYVHDESAALLGGVAGNAGLFGNAYDLAVLFQMLLDGGRYGGQQFFSQKTVTYFTSSIHGNHRGLGFDKQVVSGAIACAASASMETFGHTGFTGTCVWVDPKNELLYVFLSNRVYPTRNNKGLYIRNIRERIHQAVYDGLNSFSEPSPGQVVFSGQGF